MVRGPPSSGIILIWTKLSICSACYGGLSGTPSMSYLSSNLTVYTKCVYAACLCMSIILTEYLEFPPEGSPSSLQVPADKSGAMPCPTSPSLADSTPQIAFFGLFPATENTQPQTIPQSSDEPFTFHLSGQRIRISHRQPGWSFTKNVSVFEHQFSSLRCHTAFPSQATAIHQPDF